MMKIVVEEVWSDEEQFQVRMWAQCLAWRSLGTSDLSSGFSGDPARG